MKMIKLHNIPKNSKIYIEEKVIIFDYIDGAYSYCKHENDTVHLSANTLLEECLDGYKIITHHDTERSSVV